MKELKELIKSLSAQQKELKKARKTGPYQIQHHPEWGWPLHDKTPEIVKASWRAASEVRSNKGRITAALNLYHELRGSSYRHNFAPNDYEYNKAYKELVTVYQKTGGINCSETRK